MKNLYNEFFYAPRHAKIRDKVMLTRVVTTVLTVVFCLVAMSFAAYAYFSYDVTSDLSVIRSATFKTNISIEITADNNKTEKIQPITSNYQTFKTDELEAGKTYTVKITPNDLSNATTGFIMVTATNCKEIYHTEQLGVNTKSKAGRTESITFNLLVTKATNLVFKAHWGTSSYYHDYASEGKDKKLYITDGETVEMLVNEPLQQKELP